MRGAELSISAAGAGRKVGTQPFCFSRHGDAQRGSVAITHTHTYAYAHTDFIKPFHARILYTYFFWLFFIWKTSECFFSHTVKLALLRFISPLSPCV